MQKIALLIGLLGLSLSCNSTQKPANDRPDESSLATPVDFASTITEAELKEHLYIYASDAFEGRETGTPGQKKAVEYLKNAYEELGIAPAQGSDIGYFQKVPLEMRRLPEGTIRMQGETLRNGTEFLTFREGNGSYQEVLYVGYGIEDAGYSDYEGLDAEGKLLLMRAGEPRNESGDYLLTGSDEPSKWSNISESIVKRREVASEKGASGILFVDDANFSRYKRYFDSMARHNSGEMDLASREEGIQIILLKSSIADLLLPGWQREGANGPIPAKVELDISSENLRIDSENVVAVIPGSSHPKEYVVISSHLDHIGVEPDGRVNNGADDDGSGTVAMLEIAEAFKLAAENGKGPKRSIVFLHVTGEEKGLLGSRYYTDRDPVFPMEQTVANLNIDMIGRIDPKRDGDRKYIYLIGSDKLSSELHDLSEAINDRYTHLELDYTYNDENDPNRFYYRSDHYNFAKNHIPIIFYFSGTHADYHRPGDTPDKINYDLLQKRTELIFHTAWEIANRGSRLQVDKTAK